MEIVKISREEYFKLMVKTAAIIASGMSEYERDKEEHIAVANKIAEHYMIACVVDIEN